MIEFVFMCPYCMADDYTVVEINDTNFNEYITCGYCGEEYSVEVDVITSKPQKVKSMGTDSTLR